MERLFLANPYNKNHIELLRNFEKDYNINEKISEKLDNISKKMKESTYISNQKKANDIELYLFLEKEEKILDCCTIIGEKDRRAVKIIPLNIDNIKRRRIIKLAIDYTLDTLNMEDIFIIVSKNDKRTINYLMNQALENLGEEGNSIVYLAEKEEKERTQRMIT